MQLGDFTQLASSYHHRAGYSDEVLLALSRYLGAGQSDFQVADVGAGTGKLTEGLLALGLRVTAVEPNQAMRETGEHQLGQASGLRWLAGSAEATGLPDRSVDWVLMGSSFHWTDPVAALTEFARILKPGGAFTALWNPRALADSELHSRIEARIQALAPHIQRVSSGSSQYTQHLESTLLQSGQFGRLLFMEAPHLLKMPPERYLGAWRSVNDIQAQAGPELFEAIMQAIAVEIKGLESIEVPYRTRAWTVQLLS